MLLKYLVCEVNLGVDTPGCRADTFFMSDSSSEMIERFARQP